MNTLSKIAFAATAVLLQSSARADDGRWIYSTGVDYSTGDYGEAQDTTIVTVPTTQCPPINRG